MPFHYYCCRGYFIVLNSLNPLSTVFFHVVGFLLWNTNTFDICLQDNTINGTVLSANVLPDIHGNRFTYSLLQSKGSRYFTLNNQTGQLMSSRLIDRDLLCTESDLCCSNGSPDSPPIPIYFTPGCFCGPSTHVCLFNLSVSVVGSPGQQPDIHDVRVTVCEENDHIPTFQAPSTDSTVSRSPTHKGVIRRGIQSLSFYTINISESAPLGHRVRLPLADDVDAPPFHVQQYQLETLQMNTVRSMKTISERPFELITVRDQPNQSGVHERVSHRFGDPLGPIVGLELELKEPLDRETVSAYNYQILAIDGGTPSLTGTLQLVVRVLDINDNPPQFNQSIYEATVNEGEFGQEILRLRASDPDEGQNGVIRYDWLDSSRLSAVGVPSASDNYMTGVSHQRKVREELASAPPNYWFRLDSETGAIHLQRPLDYETKRQHRFHVLAFNPSQQQSIPTETGKLVHPSLTSTATVIINVQNLDDEPPHIVIDYATGVHNEYKVIQENLPPPYFVAFITVSDPDSSEIYSNELALGDSNPGIVANSVPVSCQLRSNIQEYVLESDNTIRSTTERSLRYSLFTKIPLDRETSAEDRVMVVCSDSGSPPKVSTAIVTVKIQDVNDCEPEIQIFSVHGHSGSRPSMLKPRPKELIRKAIDRHQDYMHTPIAVAYAASIPIYTLQVMENLPLGSTVARLRAVDNDADLNGRVTFELPRVATFTGNSNHLTRNMWQSELDRFNQVEFSGIPEALDYFELDTVKGELKVKRTIDREEDDAILDHLFLVVKANDHNHTVFALVIVLIVDENDNPPVFLEPKMDFKIQENLPAPTTVGEIHVRDPDRHPFSFFSDFTMRPDFEHFPNEHKRPTNQLQVRIDQTHGRRDLPFILYKTHDGRFFINTTRALDRESEEAFQFEILATDSDPVSMRNSNPDVKFAIRNGHTATGSVVISVLDVNDNKPVVIFPNLNTSNSTVHRISYREHAGSDIITINANDQDAADENRKLHFELMSNSKATDLFAIDRLTGLLRTRRRMTVEDVGEYELQVIIRDEGAPPLETQLALRLEVALSEPHHQSDPKGMPSFPSSHLNINGFEKNDYSSIMNHDDDGIRSLDLKHPLHSDILLIVIVIMILIVMMIMFGLCLYLRHKHIFLHYLPDPCRSCFSKDANLGSTESAIQPPCHKSYSKNRERFERNKTFDPNAQVYPGLLDNLGCDDSSGVSQPLQLDSLATPSLYSIAKGLTGGQNSHCQQRRIARPVEMRPQFRSSLNLNNAYCNYTVNDSKSGIDAHSSLPLSPSMIGLGGLMPPGISVRRPGTAVIPDVADQAENRERYCFDRPGCYALATRANMDTCGLSFMRGPGNTYNTGQFIANYVWQRPANQGQFKQFGRISETAFRPIPDDVHLYQRIYPDEKYTNTEIDPFRKEAPHSLSATADDNCLEQRRGPVNCSRRSQTPLTAWRSDPSLCQGQETCVPEPFQPLTLKTHHEKPSIWRSDSQKLSGKRPDKSECHSTLHEPNRSHVPYHHSDKHDIFGSSPPVATGNYAVSFPKVQASFV